MLTVNGVVFERSLPKMAGSPKSWKIFKIFNRSRSGSSSSTWTPGEDDTVPSCNPHSRNASEDDDLNATGMQNAFISAEQFKNLIGEKPDAVLVVDCRSVEDYKRKRIRHYNNCISVPVDGLTAGATANDILEIVQVSSLQTFIHWNRRGRFEYIILYDNWYESQEESLTRIKIIYEGLTEFDDECKSTKILLLHGGIQSLEAEHPDLIIENLLYSDGYIGCSADAARYRVSFEHLFNLSGDTENDLKNGNETLKENAKRRHTISITDSQCLECPVCYELPRNRMIFQCRNGHVVCERCIQRIEDKRCPQCRVCISERKRSRNIAMEAIIQSLQRESHT